MNVTIIQVGKTKQPFFMEAENEYIKRLTPYAKLNILTLKEVVLPKGNIDAGRKLVKEKEGKEILAHIKPGEYVIALDERGKSFTSEQFANFLDNLKNQGKPDITLIIGGCYGLSEEVLAKADLKLGLSQLTFTHEMVRTILLEQLYRAFTIQQGKTYHY